MFSKRRWFITEFLSRAADQKYKQATKQGPQFFSCFHNKITLLPDMEKLILEKKVFYHILAVVERLNSELSRNFGQFLRNLSVYFPESKFKAFKSPIVFCSKFRRF